MKKEIFCYKCKESIGKFSWVEGVPEKYYGANHGIAGKDEYICESCQARKDREYDNYVDPLHAYH